MMGEEYLSTHSQDAEKVKGMRGQTPGNWYCPSPPMRKREEQDTDNWIGGHKPGRVKVQLMIQRIPDIAGKMCTALWDTMAQISLVTHQYAKEVGFKGHPASIQISGVGSGNKKR
jgi:hypothetical protein